MNKIIAALLALAVIVVSLAFPAAAFGREIVPEDDEIVIGGSQQTQMEQSIITDCMQRIIPPVLQADNAFILWDAKGCNAMLDNYVEIRNTTGMCVTPYWEGYSADPKVLSLYVGQLVPAKVGGSDGSDYSCIPDGASAWAIAPSPDARIKGIAWTDSSSRLPPIPTTLANGYPAFAMGMIQIGPNGFELAPSKVGLTCPYSRTLIGKRHKLEDYARFDTVWCNQ